MKYSLKHFQPYLLGHKVTIITNHANLQWLTSIPPPPPQQSKLARWCLSMAEFDLTIKHHAGSAIVVPGVLSHAPLSHPSTAGDDLYLPPKPVTCFITSLIGCDIPYLKPSRVAEIFSDTLTCLTIACNPFPYTPFPPIPNPINLSLPLVLPLCLLLPLRKNPQFPHLLQQFLPLSRLC